MAIKIECGDCGKGYSVKDELDGKKIRCKECSAVIPVRAAAEDDWNEEIEEEYQPPSRKTSRSKKRRSSELGGRPLTAWIALVCLAVIAAITILGGIRVILMEVPFVPPERIVAVKAFGLLIVVICLVIQLAVFFSLLKGSAGARTKGMVLGGIMIFLLILSLLRTLTGPNPAGAVVVSTCIAIGLRITFIGCLLTPSASRHFDQ